MTVLDDILDGVRADLAVRQEQTPLDVAEGAGARPQPAAPRRRRRAAR